eukprot:3545194-Amphidinium_carterae.4
MSKVLSLEARPLWPPRRRGKAASAASGIRRKRPAKASTSAGEASSTTVMDVDFVGTALAEESASEASIEEVDDDEQQLNDNEDLLFRAQAMEQLFLEVSDRTSSSPQAHDGNEVAPEVAQPTADVEQPVIGEAYIVEATQLAIPADLPKAKAAPSRAGGVRLLVGMADAVAHVAGGRISFYKFKDAL